MVNYNQSVIYKICCMNLDIHDIYIGSTTIFRNRKHNHKSACNNINDPDHNIYIYKFIRDNGGWDNWTMIQIESYNANDKRDLESRERYYIEQMKPTLNQRRPIITKKEKKELSITHNEKLKISNDCDCSGRYTLGHRISHTKTKLHKLYEFIYS